MITFLVCALALVPFTLPDDPPDPAVVEATLEKLEAAYSSKEVPEIVAAFEAARPVLDKQVIREVARGMKHKAPEVQAAAIETLRWMKHPAALDALHNAYERNKPLMKDDELSTRVLKAIGQHAAPSSLEVLEDNPFGTTYHKAVQARIYSLGRIRTDDALEATFKMMNKAGAGRRGNNNRYVNEFRVSLTVLTGVDRGPRREDWVAWWNDNKRTFEVAPDLPNIPKEIRRKWFRYWEEPDPEAKPRKRERSERGSGEDA